MQSCLRSPMIFSHRAVASQITFQRWTRISTGVSGERGNLRSISQGSGALWPRFERMQKRSSVQKLLAFEKSVQDDFAKAA